MDNATLSGASREIFEGLGVLGRRACSRFRRVMTVSRHLVASRAVIGRW